MYAEHYTHLYTSIDVLWLRLAMLSISILAKHNAVSHRPFHLALDTICLTLLRRLHGISKEKLRYNIHMSWLPLACFFFVGRKKHFLIARYEPTGPAKRTGERSKGAWRH